MRRIIRLFSHLDWFFILIVLLAALSRLLFLDCMEYKADEVSSVAVVTDFFQHHTFFSTGLMSSAQVNNFPLFHYLLLILGILSTQPLVITALIACLNAGMVGWFYLIVKKQFPPRLAFLLSLVYAVAPWQVFFARKIWAQDIIAYFSVPLLGLLLNVVHGKATTKTWIGIGALLFLQFQLHLSGLFFLAAFIISFGFARQIKWRPFIVGCVLGCLPALPYIHFELTSQPICPDCRNYQPFAKTFTLSHLVKPLAIIGSLPWSELFGTSYDELINTYPFTAGNVIASLALAGIAMIGLVGAISKGPFRPLALIVLIVPCLYLVSGNVPRLMYYQILAPIMFFLCGLGYQKLAQSYAHYSEFVLMTVIGLNIVFLFFTFAFINQTDQIKGDYGPPYKVSDQRVAAAVAPYQSRPDYATIVYRAWFITNPAEENAGTVHLRLAHYFYQQHEPLLVEAEKAAITKIR